MAPSHILVERFTALGLDVDYAQLLAQLNAVLGSDSTARTTTAVKRPLGRAPRSFAYFAARHAHYWKRTR